MPPKTKKKASKQKERVSRPKFKYTAEEALKYLHDFFNHGNIYEPFRYEQNKKLWMVLSALRGPDSMKIEEKEAVTKVIRFTVFGYDSGVSKHAFVGEDHWNAAEFRKNRIFSSTHFQEHAKAAFDALGLEWDEVN